MKIVCIEKFKDKAGRIVGYRLEDIDTKEQKDVKAEILKETIRNNRIQVANLQLTSDGRLVDKSLNKIEMWRNKCLMLGINVNDFVIEKSKTIENEFVLRKYNGTSKKVIIPPVIEIGTGAFYETTVEEVIISSTIKQIGSRAFARCTELKGILLPDSIVDLGGYAFEECTKLTNIIIPPVKYINEGTFRRCESLKTVTLPKGLIEIRGGAFSTCNSLKEINFEDCKKLQKIYDFAFFYCNSLTNVNLSKCANLKELGQSAFNGCELLQIISLPKSIKSIDNSAFYYCKNLRTVNIESGTKLDNLGSSVFEECSNLNVSDVIKRLDSMNIGYDIKRFLL